MFSVFIYAFNAVMPVLLLVVLGYVLKKQGLFTKEWLRTANRFNFHYCLLALMFCNIYSLDSVRDIDWSLAIYIVASLLVLTAIGFVLANGITRQRNRKGVLMQVTFRSNFAVIGLPLAEALAVPGGVALLTAMQAPAVIFFNFMAVTVLSVYSEDKKMDLGKTFSGIAHNPLIRGLVLGLLVLVIREFIPRTESGTLVFSLSGNLPFLYSAISSVSKIGTPLALIVLGGQFEFGEMRTVGRELVCGVLARLILAPTVGFALAFAAARMGLITITPATMAMLVPLYSTPVAVSSSVMATEMGADDVLAGQLVVWTTIGSLFTLFFQIAAFRYVGLL